MAGLYGQWCNGVVVTTLRNISRSAASSGPTLLILRRELISRITSIWFFAIASAPGLIAWWFGFGFQESFDTETVMVTDDPLKGLNALIITFFGFVVGLRLATSVAWEREHGTLQVLLSGPATWRHIVSAKILAEIGALALFVVIYQFYLLVAQPLGPGTLSFSHVAFVAIIIVFALPLLSLGLLVSAWSRTLRGAVVAFLVVVLLLAGFEIARMALLSLSSSEASLTALYLRVGFEAVAPFLRPISAAASVAVLFESVAQQSPINAMHALWAVALTVITVAAAYFVARVRGVS